MRFLIAGLGSIGEQHFRNLRALGYRDIAVYRTTDRPPRTLSGEKFFVFRSLDDALAWGPDVVLITSPTHTHMPIALEAARHGVHLFIDKPLSHTLGGTEELINLAQEKSLVTLMGFNLRFHPCVRKARELVLEGAVGRVISVQAECASYLPDWHPWEDYRDGYAAHGAMGGGALLVAGVHELDYLCWIFGAVEEVFCVTGKQNFLELRGAEESAAVILKFRNGVIGELHCDLLQRPSSRWCKIVGERGTICWDFAENRVKLYAPFEKSWKVVLDSHGLDYTITYVEEIRHLIECVQQKVPSINDFREGRQNLQLALKALESARTGEFLEVA